MTLCFFASDLHGQTDLYLRLFDTLAEGRPAAAFLGGDLLPAGPRASSGGDVVPADFLDGFLFRHLRALRMSMGPAYPRIFAILGNDDRRADEPAFVEAASHGLLEYVHLKRAEIAGFDVYGYACSPPSPFSLKDWERYDVSRFTDPGAVSPEAGRRTVHVSEREARYTTIQEELDELVGDRDLARAVMLFHAPPYKTKLDRADLEGQTVDHAPLDVHVGSIAIRRLIEHRQPAVTLHGHVHESARLTGAWSDRIGRTVCLSAAHEGPELALVRFSLEKPAEATRELL